ncbi:MAG: helix-turn-helix domain-containing protein [Actinomycetota bacterium]|nr:helix-turn-helix domain-containing protein [Actinomycetota bacterium]
MGSGLGEQIRQQRERLGWDQADLAREVGGVTQQTVSRWERGASRPRRHVIVRLASLLDLDPRELLGAAGYGALADRPDEVPLPVRPRATVLPVAALSPDRFEEFVADVARRLYPDTHVSRFGAQGHTQYGFDVIAQNGGRLRAGFQCKRRRQFGREDVREAVRAATIDVDDAFIVLTRVASPDCRIEMASHAGWTLWDIEDLSREVRGLPLDDAVRIVDTYFPGWREPLLGVAEPGPWLQPDEFFRPLASSRVYTHDWQLVGRTEQLEGLLDFLNGDDRLGCVVGRGGIGKTRLLREVAVRAEADGQLVRFITTGADLKPEHFELLPTQGHLVVIVDDAHERSDIAAVLRAIAQRNPDARVVIALRPYGFGLLASDLRQVGLHPTDIPRWELDDLTPDDAESLTREAVGPDATEALVRRLAHLTADCPLITVVAGVLIQRGELDPACLDHEDTVRTEVLRAFRDVLVADSVGGDPVVRRGVLDAVAALQPFRSDDSDFRTTLAELAGVPYDRTVAHLKGLEDAGVLLRRGASLRVVPDLLGDVVLAEACFDERSGTSTGYIERACEVAGTGPLQNVFVNASRIDWQVRHDHANAPWLTDTLWSQVETEFDVAGILGRRRLLELLRRVAHFAPRPTLALVRRAIENPTNSIEDVGDLEGAFLRLHPPTYDDVMHELPPLLRGIAYDLKLLPEALDTLWKLAQSDDRPTNQHPQHALRVLRDLAELELGKPLAYNHAVVDAAERWLVAGTGGTSQHSPFDALEPMLATEGMEDLARGYQLVFKPFVLTPTSVAPLRERILDLAFRELSSPDLRVAVRAADAIGHSLRYPHGYFGQEVDASERDAWTPEFVSTLDRLAHALGQPGLDPVVTIAVRKAIRWHADHSRTATRDAAQRVRNAMPTRPEDELALALYDGWGHLTEGREKDFEKMQARRERRAHDLARRLTAAASDEEILQHLEDRLNAQSALGPTTGNAGPFVWALVTARPSIGVALAERLAVVPTSPMLQVLAVSVAAIAEHAPSEAMSAITALLESGELILRQQVAQALGWNRGARPTLLEGELDALVRLATDVDVFTRTCVVRAAQRLAASNADAAVRLLAEVPFSDSTTVADEVFQVLGPHGELDWRQLPAAHVDKFLLELERCPSIEDYWIMAFLSDFSGERPEDLIRLLQARVERWEHADSLVDYRALPFNWDHDLRVRGSRDFPTILRRIRDWIAASPDSWHRLHAGAELFAAVAVSFDETVMSVLEEGASASDESQMTAVAAILRQAPRTFVFDNVDFVRRLLALAAQLGEDHVQRVGGALSAAAVSGVRTGIPGQPFAEDLDQRDQARKIADAQPNGSPEQRLYRSLQESAEHTIKWHADRDEPMDGRHW